MTVPNSGYMMENGSIELPCTPEREKQIIAEITDKAESNPQEGDLYYVISKSWLSGWQNYVGQHIGADRPGPIDNTNIISNCEGDDDLQLLRTLEEQIDYVLVPQGVWEKLFEWYRGGPVLPRKMIAVGVQETLVVEVYPLCLKLVDARDGNQSTTIIRLSKKVSLHQLYEKVCGIKGIEPQKVRIWDYFNDSKQTLLVDSYQTLEECNLQMDQPILLEMQSDGFSGMDSTGNQLALEPLRSSLTIAGGPTLSNGNATDYSSILHRRSTLRSSSREDNFDILKPVSNRGGRGLAGLQNLGNTCFMNSALQCLVHTLPLVEYFLQDYFNEINKKNPLGMRGELAIAFGELLRELWSSAPGTPVAPRAFKGKLGRFASQFSGYNQHDSQELLAFLLDGLHEDLNRVKQKPYFEAKDFDGCPDKEAADEYWRHHKARNDSIIVDVCQGQYKSTLVCPVCSKISVTFDPFMYLSLPLPSTATRAMTVTVFYGDGSGLPIPYTVTILKQGACKDLSLALASACCLNDDECLLLAEVYNHAIHRFLDVPLEPLSSIEEHEHIVAYRIPKKSTGTTRLEIRHRYLKGGEMKLFLTPLVTYLEVIQSGADIDLAVNRLLSPLRRKPYLSKDVDSSFQLCITGERVFRCRPIAKDTPIKPDRVVKVLLDWTEKDYELYDGSYLKDLPEVGPTVKKTRQEAISLFSCLDAFLNEEPLGADDMWHCPRCKEHRQATKKLDLWRLPEILVVHLKRFSYSRYLKKKLDTFVNFPIQNLDLSKYVKCEDGSGQSHVYELYAISNHFGGLGGGHYTAYAKLIDDKRWYNFNDSSVSPVAEADIRTSAAYVLFYRRVKANGIIGEPSQGHGVS